MAIHCNNSRKEKIDMDRIVKLITMPKKTLDLVNRILKSCKVEQRGFDTPCWVWKGGNSGESSTSGRTYGRISAFGATSAVHRVMYSCFNGYLPPSKEVDHLCNNSLCCNPDHLEMTTRKQNLKRRDQRNAK